MNAIQQRCRPKHQVLVLRCYPRTTKGAVDVKPNSSELSYLLFYATSRRSKIQKIGSFLEKKTASDVWRLRIGNVQVTLGILAALIEKSPKDLPLFATNVLKILDQILRSKDLTMAESSIPTFEAFCEHHDPSSLLADLSYLRQYEAVVRAYAALASARQGSTPVEMRRRNAGLEAIRAVASADALASLAGRQLDVVVPMILENLWTDNDDFLELLHDRVHVEEKIESEKLLRRRTSIATVRTVDTAGDTNPIALSGTAGDVDRLAEEEIGVLAMQCLKQLFIVPNRPQVHAATAALLRFVEERVRCDDGVLRTDVNTGRDSGWAIKMLDLVSRWAPMQDRYVILVTTVDALARTPIEEDDKNLRLHVVLAAMVGSLLRSDINLIGLSVMDVLMALIKHIKRLLQLPGASTQFQWQQAAPDEAETSSAAESSGALGALCKELLGRLQQCIGDLATHVYYADQISDMIAAILFRLKPSRSSSTNSSPQGEKAEGSGTGGAPSAVDLTEGGQPAQHLDAYFSANAGKTAALKAIKAILLVANPKTKIAGNVSLSRNRVPVQVWEGTHWLLRDPDGAVRKAYVDALLTWLERETTAADLRARDESLATLRSSMKNSRELPPPGSAAATTAMATVARRAASSASNREKQPAARGPSRSHFLQLIHIAIYDNALQYVDFETDIVMLHVLLAKLVLQLGVNAARYGMPMIFRLQEDILDVDAPVHKVRIGSLCHGYFWVLTDKFDCEASVVGRAVHNEIVRRRSKHFWVEGIHLPPPLLELVGTPGLARPQPRLPLHEIESESLLPFDDRISLVQCVATGYQEALGSASPPTSPAASPGRTFAHPVLGSTLSTIPAAGAGADADKELPLQFREQMLAEWSREAAMIAMQAGSKSESLNGSRAGTTGTAANRARLGVNGAANGNGMSSSPYGSQANLRPGSPHGLGIGPLTKLRKSSVRSRASQSPSGSSRGFVASVEQLKMVLSGTAPAGPLGSSAGAPHGGGDDDDDGSGTDSMVSYEFTPSEMSLNLPSQGESGEAASSSLPPSQPQALTLQRTASGRERKEIPGGGPLNSNPTHDARKRKDGEAAEDDREEAAEEENVPPVPPLPSLGVLASKSGELTVQDTSSPQRQSQSPPQQPQQQAGGRPGSRGGRPSSRSKAQGVAPGLTLATSHEHHHHGKGVRRNLSTRGGESAHGGAGSGVGSSPLSQESGMAGMDLQELLRGIDARAGEGSLGGVSKPPY